MKNFFLKENRIRGFLESSVHRKEVVTDEMVDEYLKRLRVAGFDDAFRGLLASASGPEARVTPENLRQPTLIVWGVHDRVIPIRVGEALSERISAARLVRFESSGHLPMDEEPEKFVETMRDFLSRTEE